jgi:hypothetical protein
MGSTYWLIKLRNTEELVSNIANFRDLWNWLVLSLLGGTLLNQREAMFLLFLAHMAV